jgi:quinone-modifying oxidoreductase subunit QmoA
MVTTKAIHLPYEMAYPMRFVIDGAVCPGTECAKCVPACAYDAIDLEMEAETIELDTDAVIWATGWDGYDASAIEELGFGTSPDIITNLMMERLATRSGPTGGRIVRPSDRQEIKAVAFVQCAGSRDENHLPYCSGVCCLASLKQARYVREQYPDAEIYVFYIDIRAPGRLEDFYQTSQEDEKLTLIKGKVGKVTATNGRLTVEAEDAMAGTPVRQEVDLVVLATGMVPAYRGEAQVEGGLAVDDAGFLTDEQPNRGILVAGCAKRPTDVATSLRDATGAAMKALQICAE